VQLLDEMRCASTNECQDLGIKNNFGRTNTNHICDVSQGQLKRICIPAITLVRIQSM
jgi:hypothetical protein